MNRQSPQIKVRLPTSLKEWLREEAQRNRRTQNAEIVFRLDQSRTLAATPAGSGNNALGNP